MELLSRSNATHGRQVQMFCCFVNLSQEEVRKYYMIGPEDQYESVGINFFTLDHIVNIMVYPLSCFHVEYDARTICS